MKKVKVERKDMTKKEWLDMQKAKRVLNAFNTGTRTFKDKKHPSRQKLKQIARSAW